MRFRSVLTLCSLYFLATFLAAQVISTAQIRGTIEDPSGAAVAGAQIRLTQTATDFVRTVTSGADGGYILLDLPPGTYQMEITKQSFKKSAMTGIVLAVGDNPTINLKLEVGAVTEQVEVSAAAAMVETQTANVGTEVSPTEVQQLPLNGREMTDLLQFTGGTATNMNSGLRTFYGSAVGNAETEVSIAGSMPGDISYYLDTGVYNDPLSNLNLPLPFPDTIQEFKIETSSSPAQYGVHPGGDVTVVTKSGTNSFHGDLFEFVRNYVFDSDFTGDSACVALDDIFFPARDENISLFIQSSHVAHFVVTVTSKDRGVLGFRPVVTGKDARPFGHQFPLYPNRQLVLTLVNCFPVIALAERAPYGAPWNRCSHSSACTRAFGGPEVAAPSKVRPKFVEKPPRFVRYLRPQRSSRRPHFLKRGKVVAFELGMLQNVVQLCWNH